jgi:hypothetical protein
VNNNSTNSYYISETPTAPDEKELTMCAAKGTSTTTKKVFLMYIFQNEAIYRLIDSGNKSSTPPANRLPGGKV